MDIKNSSSNAVSWFCFNHLDAFKLIALESGTLYKNALETCLPPQNIDGFYGVRFTAKGGGKELAHGTVSREGMIELIEGEGGTYSVKVSPDP